MKTKITFLSMAFFLSLLGIKAQTECIDLNGYVNSKNQSVTGFYTLNIGYEEYAAQTYHYSGPGKVSQVRVYGQYPDTVGGVPLRVSIYNVDANGRPTSILDYTDRTFMSSDNAAGYITVTFGEGGVSVNNSFAVEVEVRQTAPFGNSFQLKYTGDGEGLSEDLASLAGTSTGFNWTSAIDNFDKDGDFYLVPVVTNFITSAFTASSRCVNTTTAVTFTNNTLMTKDIMYNTIGLPNYAGTNHYYSWNFGDGSAVSYIENPTHAYSSPGVYKVSLTSTIDGWNNDCSDIYTMDISVGLGVSATSVVDVTCNGGNDGSVTALGTGGAAPYKYYVSLINSMIEGEYQSNDLIENLTPNDYILSVIDTLGCFKTTPFTILQPEAIVFTTSSSTNASCGTTNGSVLVAATGGVGAMQYKLNNGSFQSSGAFSNLASGSYEVIAKDANGCLSTSFINVNDSGSPVLSILSTTNVSCFGSSDGSLILMATGGSGTLQYSINGGANFQTSGSFPNLPEGSYPLLVKDAANCKSGTHLTITQPSKIEFGATSNSVSCHGGSDGAIDITSVTGGIGTFKYSINGTNFQSGTHFQGLLAGTYTVYVKDVASCMSTKTIVVNQHSEVSAIVSKANESCHFSEDGNIIVVGTGGSGHYRYSINEHPFQPTGAFYGLEAGTYKIIVEDLLACPYTIFVTLTHPAAIAATSVTGNSTCGNSNGSILVTATGGSGSGFQYSLDGNTYNSTGSFTGKRAGTYYVYVKDGTGCNSVVVATINDANGPVLSSTSHTNASCNDLNDGTITVNTVSGGTGTLEYTLNGTNWQTASSFSGLFAGTYSIIVRDANGCIGTETITLTEPNAFSINTTVSNVLCHGSDGGSVYVAAAGGSGTMAYSINGGTTFQSSPNFASLFAGTYTIIVRDAAGCTGSKGIFVTQPHDISITEGVLNVSCHGAADGAFSVTASGGVGTLQYSMNGYVYQNANLFSGLAGGSYTAYVKDANNCIKTKAVNISEPPALLLVSNVTNVSCKGGNNGVVDLSVVGGVAGYNILWSSGSVWEDIFNITAGTYSVTVTDANGCTKTNSYTITEPLLPLIINAVVTPSTTATSEDGAIDITVTGGTPLYSYSWSNSAFLPDLENLPIGIYTITVTDANNCTTTNEFEIVEAVGIADLNNNLEEILVYPNPANEKFLIESNHSVIQKLKVMNVLGQVVIEAEPKNVKCEINISALEQGAYFVQVYLENTVVTKKLKIVK